MFVCVLVCTRTKIEEGRRSCTPPAPLTVCVVSITISSLSNREVVLLDNDRGITLMIANKRTALVLNSLGELIN